MRKYRIENYGIYKNIFDVQMNTWWCGWITIKTFEQAIFVLIVLIMQKPAHKNY